MGRSWGAEEPAPLRPDPWLRSRSGSLASSWAPGTSASLRAQSPRRPCPSPRGSVPCPDALFPTPGRTLPCVSGLSRPERLEPLDTHVPSTFCAPGVPTARMFRA